jgi:hypothetical protein
MAARFVGHHLVATPWLLAAAWLFWRFPSVATAAALAVGLAFIEVAFRVFQSARFVGDVLVCRKAVAFHRRWPRVWADYAGRTKRVQAETGKEPSTPVRYRPLVDHPRLSWLFLPSGRRSVTFVIASPPDRAFDELAVGLAALSSSVTWVDELRLWFPSSRASIGLLTVNLTDPLDGVDSMVFDEVPA